MTPELRDFAIREIGCIACLIAGYPDVPCEKHHLTSTGRHGNGKRRGDQATIGLCQFHHRGAAAVGTITARMMRLHHGPSYADEPEAFRHRFGDDDTLLQVQNAALEAWKGQTV